MQPDILGSLSVVRAFEASGFVRRTVWPAALYIATSVAGTARALVI